MSFGEFKPGMFLKIAVKEGGFKTVPITEESNRMLPVTGMAVVFAQEFHDLDLIGGMVDVMDDEPRVTQVVQIAIRMTTAGYRR